MAKSGEALVTPSVMAWARETAGLSINEAAELLRLRPVQIEEWEQGVLQPSLRQARDAARVYRRPFSAFFLAAPPTTFRVPHDFRTLGDRHPGPPSRNVLSEIRRVRFQRQVVVDIAEDGKEFPFDWIGSATTKEDIETLALSARARLGVALPQQLGWKSPYDSFNGWRSAFENLGVLICQLEGVDVDEVRGVSINEIPFPVIVANAQDHPHGRVFTLFHEYGHLLLSESGICDLVDPTSAKSHDQRVERFCNSFAAAALLPKEPLLSASGLASATKRKDWSLQELSALSELFGVSREAILRRFVTLEVTSFDVYFAIRQELHRKAQDSVAEQADTQGRGPSQSTRAIRRGGPLFARIVLEAYDREAITTSDVAEFLGVRTKHFSRIRTSVMQSATDEAAAI